MNLEAIKLNTIVTILSIIAFVGGGATFMWKAGNRDAEFFAELRALRAADTVTTERVVNLEKRVDAITALQISIATMAGDMKIMGAKVDGLCLDVQATRHALEEHQRNTTEMLKGMK